MTEPIDIKKAVTSPFTGLYWVKTIMYGLGLSVLLLMGFCVWHTFFKKTPATQDIHMGSGDVHIVNEANKRHLILFAEPYVFTQTSNGGEAGIGIRGGCRWEF